MLLTLTVGSQGEDVACCIPLHWIGAVGEYRDLSNNSVRLYLQHYPLCFCAIEHIKNTSVAMNHVQSYSEQVKSQVIGAIYAKACRMQAYHL